MDFKMFFHNRIIWARDDWMYGYVIKAECSRSITLSLVFHILRWKVLLDSQACASILLSHNFEIDKITKSALTISEHDHIVANLLGHSEWGNKI